MTASLHRHARVKRRSHPSPRVISFAISYLYNGAPLASALRHENTRAPARPSRPAALCRPTHRKLTRPRARSSTPVEMSGFSPYDLSPGLQKDINALVGAPLSRERLNELASRIEGEQPEVVAAVRSVARPDGKAHVVFLVGRISDDTHLTENINARYIVESVEIEGPSGRSQPAASRRSAEARWHTPRHGRSRSAARIAWRANCPAATSRGGFRKAPSAGTIRVVFEIFEDAVDSLRAAAIEARVSRPAGLERCARHPDERLAQPSSVHRRLRVQRHRRPDRGIFRFPAARSRAG